MTDTYSNVQSDAQRSLAINRAWIVARVEHNTLLAFVSTYTVTHIHGMLNINNRITEGETTGVVKLLGILMVNFLDKITC